MPAKAGEEAYRGGVSRQAGFGFTTAEKMRILNEFRAFAAVGGKRPAPYPGN